MQQRRSVSTSAIELYLFPNLNQKILACPIAFSKKCPKMYYSSHASECFLVFHPLYYKKILSQVWLLRFAAFYCACVCVKKDTSKYGFIFVSCIFTLVKASTG